MAEALVAAVVAQAPEVLAAIPLYAASQWQAGFGLLQSADQAVQALGLRLVLDALSCTPHSAMDLVMASRAVLAG